MLNDSPAEFIDAEFNLQLAEGNMRVVLPVPAQEVNLTALLPIIQHFTSGIAQHMAGVAAKSGEPIRCGPKCGACCRQLVPISSFEAEFLASWIRSLPMDQQATLAGKFRQALLTLQQKGVLSRLNPEMFELSPEDFKALNQEYFAAWVSCPFLVDESCSIHPIRPLICREYMVVTPPEYCAEPGHTAARGVVLPVRPSRALIKLSKRVEDDGQGWLPLVFLLSWMTANIEPGKAITGPGPAVIQEFIAAL